MSDPFIYLEFVRKVMSTLPGTTAGSSYGTPGFHVQKKFLARLWENGEVLVVRIDDRNKWIERNPEVFFITDHYQDYPAVLVNLPKVDPRDLEELIIEGWMGRASKNMVKEYQSRLQ
jgi:hypothetical protein